MQSNYPLVFFVAVYEKSGDQHLVVDYELKDVELNFLDRLFNDPNDPNPSNREMVGCCVINKEQAKALQPYVNFVFDFQKYHYMFEVRGDYSLSDLFKS